MINIKKKEIIIQKMLIIIVSIFSFLFMIYGDILITYKNSLMLLDSTINGTFLSCVNSFLSESYFYLTVFIIFSIWNLPTWVITRTLNLNQDSIGFIYWCKLLVVFSCIIFLFYFSRIMRDILKYKTEIILKTTLCTLTSLGFFLPIFTISQYDIVFLSFTFAGVYYYLIEKKRRAIILFAIAVSFKGISLFLILPLLLIKQKRINKLIFEIISVFSIIIFWFLFSVISGSSGFRADSFDGKMIDQSFGVMFHTGLNTDASLIIVIILCLYIFSFVKKTDNNVETITTYSLVVFVEIISFFMLVHANPYWICIVIPYLQILLSQKRSQITTILDLIFNISLVTCMIMKFEWVFGSNSLFEKLLLQKTNSYKFGSINEVLYVHFGEKLPMLAASVLVATSLSLISIFLKKDVVINSDKTDFEKITLSLNIVILYLYLSASLICFIYKG